MKSQSSALGVVFLSKSWKIAIVPSLLMILIFLLIPATYAVSGILIPVMSVLAVLIARWMFITKTDKHIN